MAGWFTKKTTMHALIQTLIYLAFCLTVYSSLENQASAGHEDPPPWRPWKVAGVQRLVVIGVDFSDVSHSVNASTIKTRLSNMADYFYNISFGSVVVNFTFFGDNWQRLNNTMEYYGQDGVESMICVVGIL